MRRSGRNYPPHVTVGEETYNLENIEIPEQGANKFVPVVGETGVATLVGSQESAAPLIVEADYDEENGIVVRSNGQPTFDQTKVAFLAGRNVLVKIFEENVETITPINCYWEDTDVGGEEIAVYYNNLKLILWWD